MELVDSLISLGLSDSEAKVYLHLLKNNNCTATEIAKSTGISRTQTYQVIDNLLKSNMCIEQLGSVKKYMAVDPKKVTTSIQNTLEKKRELLESLTPQLSALFEDENQNENPFDFIKVLYTKASIIQTIEALEKSATESVLAFNKPPYAMNIDIMNENEISMQFRNSERQSINNGVTYHSLYEIEDNADFIKKIDYFQAMGEEVRVVPTLPFKLFIFDSKIVTIALQNKMSSGLKFVTLLIEHSDFAKALQEIFYLYWENSMIIDEFKTTIIQKGEAE